MILLQIGFILKGRIFQINCSNKYSFTHARVIKSNVFFQISSNFVAKENNRQSKSTKSD